MLLLTAIFITNHLSELIQSVICSIRPNRFNRYLFDAQEDICGVDSYAVNPKPGFYCHECKVKYLERIWKFQGDDQFVIATASRTITR